MFWYQLKKKNANEFFQQNLALMAFWRYGFYFLLSCSWLLGMWIDCPAFGCNMACILIGTQCGWVDSDSSHQQVPIYRPLTTVVCEGSAGLSFPPGSRQCVQYVDFAELVALCARASGSFRPQRWWWQWWGQQEPVHPTVGKCDKREVKEGMYFVKKIVFGKETWRTIIMYKILNLFVITHAPSRAQLAGHKLSPPVTYFDWVPISLDGGNNTNMYRHVFSLDLE